MSTTTGNIGIAGDELSPASIDDAWDSDEPQILEGDIRELSAYTGWESDHQTLLGIGKPPKRRAGSPPPGRPALRPPAPESQPMPLSEPPGPFIADDDELPPSLRRKKLGIWGVAMPALLVAAAVAVLVLRGLGPGFGKRQAAVLPVPVAHTAGLAVKLSGVDAHVYLDGHDRGVPPVLLLGLEPGSHAVSISGAAYAPFVQPVTLVAGNVSTIEPTLTFVRGAIHLSAGEGADGAYVEVVGASETREIKSLPATIEVPPGAYDVRATRAGYSVFAGTVTLSAGTPTADVKVELEPVDAKHGARHADATAPVAAPTPAATDAPAPATGTPISGAISITSSPPSNVVLDGRPIGRAPRVVDVAPGTHTLVFVHPALGRQSVTVNVSAGKTASATADF